MRILTKSLKSRVRQRHLDRLHSSIKELTTEELRQPALVFSPHPDDETLGCGGTIIRKIQLGADVKVVFMTDGSNSHSHLVSTTELKALRRKEAISATRKLGLAETDVYFLDFIDGSLYKSHQTATAEVRKILDKYPDDQIFIPYHREDLRDHRVTNKIVRNAMPANGSDRVIYEYPIWFWAHWPWIDVQGSNREKFYILKNTVLALFGSSLVRNFSYGVRIHDVLDVKRKALAEHRSQTEKLIADNEWWTLGDIADGQFLECFFREYEFFYRA